MTTNKLVIIGACKPKNRSSIHEQDIDVTEWNNPNQAGHYTLVMLKQEYPDIEIICIDPLYLNDAFINDIKYVKDYFKQVEVVSVLDKKSHNIVIEFCNFYNENWSSDGVGKPYIDSKYKVSWLACGCMWSDGFPKDAFDKIIQDKLYTPFDSTNVDSYLTSIGYTSSIKEKFMKPFMQGIYQVLGSIMFRGCAATDYLCEEPLRELFQIVDSPLNYKQQEELQIFINGEKHWNNLSLEIRRNISEFIYGN